MKKVKVEPKETEIDWSKPMWVQCIDTPDKIILTTSYHNGDFFSGMFMPCDEYPRGCYSETWIKERFKPLTTTIPFEISNDND